MPHLNSLLSLVARFATCLVVAYCGVMIITTVGKTMAESSSFDYATLGIWIMLVLGMAMIAMAMIFSLPLSRTDRND